MPKKKQTRRTKSKASLTAAEDLSPAASSPSRRRTTARKPKQEELPDTAQMGSTNSISAPVTPGRTHSSVNPDRSAREIRSTDLRDSSSSSTSRVRVQQKRDERYYQEVAALAEFDKYESSVDDDGDEDRLVAIVRRKWHEACKLEAEVDASPTHPLALRRDYMTLNPGSITLAEALRTQDKFGIIGDVRRRPDHTGKMLVPLDWARRHRSAGVQALAVAGDVFDQGSADDVRRIVYSDSDKPGARVSMPPILVNDYIVHPIQIAQAAEAGAQGVLLMMSVLGHDVEELINWSTLMGIEPCVEVRTEEEVNVALSCGATLLCVNMLDRSDPSKPADLSIAEKLAPLIPANPITSIITGGIRDVECAWLMRELGFTAVWVGDALATSSDPAKWIERARRGEVVTYW